MLKKIQNKLRLRRALKEEQLRDIPTHFDHAIFEWSAPEYLQYHKEKTWFAVFSVVIGLFGMYALVMKDYLFATAILLFGAVYCLTHRDKPSEVKVTLSRLGLKIGTRIYPYDQIKAFWIIYKPPFVQTINFRLEKKFLPDVEIHLKNQSPSELKGFLAQHVPEWIERQETLTESLIRLLRL